MNKDNKRCPNCGSMAIQRIGMGMFGICLVMASCMVAIIPIIGWIVGFIGVILGLLCIIASPFSKKVSYRCNSCKYNWIEDKEK